MGKKGQSPKNTVVIEGMDSFPDNKEILRTSKFKNRTTEYLNLDEKSTKWQYYHGPHRSECLIVLWRRERTYQEHFLDIWYCLEHMKEVCRCGMEDEYYLKELYQNE